MVHEKKLERGMNGKYRNCLRIVSVYLTVLTVYSLGSCFTYSVVEHSNYIPVKGCQVMVA